MKLIFLILGIVSLLLGIIGIIIPGLPTTPFLLLAASLFLRSSERLYRWLLSHKYLGAYIKKFQKKGIDLQTLVSSLSLMWVMILVSSFFLLSQIYIKIIVISVGVIGSFVMYRIYHKNKKRT